MAKLLTNREMELFRLAMAYAMNYEEVAAAAVGYHTSKEVIAKRISSALSFGIDEDDIAEMCETITGS
jgi:hypothetical protein